MLESPEPKIPNLWHRAAGVRLERAAAQDAGAVRRGDVRADALGSVLQVHVGRFWGLLGWDTFLVSDLGWETGFGLLSPS